MEQDDLPVKIITEYADRIETISDPETLERIAKERNYLASLAYCHGYRYDGPAAVKDIVYKEKGRQDET
jgi:hypothetical protein